MGGKENGENERGGGRGARAAVREAKEEEKPGLEEGTLGGHDGEVGEGENGGRVEPVISSQKRAQRAGRA